MKSSVPFTFASLLPIISAQYILQDDYSTTSFANMFDFYTGADPTAGYVTYVDQSTAETTGLFSTNNGSIYIGVDSTNVASGSGRNSVRLTSTASYNHGLIVLDLAHMPGGQCGTWPAFWMLGPDWPVNGELDIIEGVNSATENTMTLHTNAGCSITNTGSFSGSIATSNCDVNAPNQATNQGCSIDTQNGATYGTGFNSQAGGVYATEWTSESISIWYFPRSAIPSDITSGTPNPSGWGMALSSFSGACDLDAHVDNMQIVFDTTFCGDWAGNAFTTDATCSPLATTCQDYVQNNPSAFAETYWSVNSLRVYQQSGEAVPTPSATVTPTASATGFPETSTIYVTEYSSTYSTPAATVYVPPTSSPSVVTLTVTSAAETTYPTASASSVSVYWPTSWASTSTDTEWSSPAVPTTFSTATAWSAPPANTWTTQESSAPPANTWTAPIPTTFSTVTAWSAPPANTWTAQESNNWNQWSQAAPAATNAPQGQPWNGGGGGGGWGGWGQGGHGGGGGGGGW